MISDVWKSNATRSKVSFQSAPIPILLGIGVLSLCTLSSAGFAALGVRDLLTARESEGWPATRGIVVASGLRETSVPFSAGSPSIRYRYQVGPKTYEAVRIAFGRASAPSLELVNKYRTGSEVGVHYHKQHPGRAVLEPGGSILGMGAAFYVSIVSLLATAAGVIWIIPRISWRE
jgi:hypothetical protein